MLGLDEHIADLGAGSLALALVVAVALGLRHATDPDHLTAVATLIAGDERHGLRRARRLGVAWGLGHATTLLVFGAPVVVASHALPEAWQTAAEAAVGVLICLLAARLLTRWRRGAYHGHPHSHGGRVHAHPHAHEHPHEHTAHPEHEHSHDEALGRSPLAAYGIGLVHGIGGSAGAGILLVGAIADDTHAMTALLLFAAGAAVSMALVSAVFGHMLARGVLARRLGEVVVPVTGTLSLLFGVWYALGAVAAVPYPL